MCSSPDALHLRQLKQFAAVVAAAHVPGKKIRGNGKIARRSELSKCLGFKKGEFYNPQPDEFDFSYFNNILKCILDLIICMHLVGKLSGDYHKANTRSPKIIHD